MKPRNRFQEMNSASLCSLAGRYDNPIPPRFLALIDCLKIPALEKLRCFCTFHFRRRQIYVKSILTVETELNGDARVQMKGVLPWLVPWALCAGTRDVYPALAALASPVQNMFFSLYTALGRQSCRAACLWMFVSGHTLRDKRFPVPLWSPPIHLPPSNFTAV